MAKIIPSVLRRLKLYRDTALGEIEVRAGLPVTHKGSFRHAVHQWRNELNDLPPIKERFLLTALRNAMWMEWPVWCAVVLRRMGYASTLVYSSRVMRQFYGPSYRRDYLEPVATLPDIELVDLDEISYPADSPSSFAEQAKDWSYVAIAYDTHVEEEDVRQNPDQYQAVLDRYLEMAPHLASTLREFLKARGQDFSRFIVYSGLIGETPLLLAVAREVGITTVCVEGWAWRPGHMLFNVNAPALEYNVQSWQDHLGPWDDEKEREINAYLKFLDGEDYGDQDWLGNFYNIQKSKVKRSLPPRLQNFLEGSEPVFLLAPNVVGDSSTLRRETIFPSMKQWLKETIAWFRDRPDLKLIVRAHPAEQWIGGKCIIYMGEIARELAEDAPNVFVIDSTEKTNTFSLLPFVRAGLVWLSSAGADMVARGIPVLCGALPKYTGLGVVIEPKTTPEFFEHLERLGHAEERPTHEQIAAAKRYLHLVFRGFSFEARSRSFRIKDCTLDRMPAQEEHDQFYRILAGEVPPPGVLPEELMCDQS